MSDILQRLERERKLEKIRGKSSPGTRGRSVESLRAPTQLGLDFAQAEAEAAEAELVISYSTAEGVLVCGATRQWKEAIKASRLGSKRFRFSRNLPGDCGWYVVGTRDKPLELAPLEATAEQLRAAGATVDVKYTAPEAPRSFGEREAERAGRAAPRIERLEARAGRLEAEAAAGFASARTDEATTGIPFGQPILVGHHSEGKHRRTLERAERRGFKALETSREAKSADWRAKGAARREEARTDPGVTKRRIGRLETELRKVRRNLHGHPGKGTTMRTSPATGEHRAKLEAMERELDGQIKYWAAELGEHLSAGTAREWGPKDFAKGGIVLGSHGWAAIIRVNKTTLTVDYLKRELRPLNSAKLAYDRVERLASGPVEDAEVRGKFADYFAKAAPAKQKKAAPAKQQKKVAALKWSKPGSDYVSSAVIAEGTAFLSGTRGKMSHVFKIEKNYSGLWPMRLVLQNEPDNVTATIPTQGGTMAFPSLAKAKAEAERLVADGTYPVRRETRGTSQQPGHRDYELSRGVEKAIGKPGVMAAASAARTTPVGEVMKRKIAAEGAGATTAAFGWGEKHDPAKKAAKKKAAKKRGAKYPALEHHTSYHWGHSYQHATASMQAHPQGYTVGTGYQGKRFKTQAGAEKWLLGIIGPHRFDGPVWLWVGDKDLPRLVKPGARLPSNRIGVGDRKLLAHLKAQGGEHQSVELSQLFHGHSGGWKVAAVEDALAKLQAAGMVKKRSTKDRGYYRAV